MNSVYPPTSPQKNNQGSLPVKSQLSPSSLEKNSMSFAVSMSGPGSTINRLYEGCGFVGGYNDGLCDVQMSSFGCSTSPNQNPLKGKKQLFIPSWTSTKVYESLLFPWFFISIHGNFPKRSVGNFQPTPPAFQSVDFSIVTNVSKGMGTSPGWESVGGEAGMHQPRDKTTSTRCLPNPKKLQATRGSRGPNEAWHLLP